LGWTVVKITCAISTAAVQAAKKGLASFFTDASYRAWRSARAKDNPRLAAVSEQHPEVFRRERQICLAALSEGFSIGQAPWISDLVYIYTLSDESLTQIYARVRAFFRSHDAEECAC
jgi:hypothetical protein